VKLIDETITAFPRVWSRSDDGVSAQLHEEDHLKPEPGNNKIVSYPSNSFRQACTPVWYQAQAQTVCPSLLEKHPNVADEFCHHRSNMISTLNSGVQLCHMHGTPFKFRRTVELCPPRPQQ